ncbi:MAG: sigma-70 family RNA polymerase sigma factor [bacterium]|nr:sigma-70 family RNA polymerase sigma factor [bacterium]
MRNATDDDLIALAQGDAGGDLGRRAASELLGRYRSHVYRWCRKYQPDGERTLDMAQEVLLNAYRKLPSFGGRSRFSSWLFTLTRNRCLDELRKNNRHTEDLDSCHWLADPTADPAAATHRREEEQLLRQRLASRLAPLEQDAVWLRYVEGMSVDEIGAVLHITAASGARGVLQTARRKLRGDWPGDLGPREVSRHE